MALSLMRANIMVHMGGVMFVNDIEVGTKVRQLTIDDPDTFLRLPFDEAIQHFLSRNYLTLDEFEKLTEKERKRAFAVKGVAVQAMLDRIKERLDDAMQPGGTGLREFVKAFEGEAATLTPRFLENIYRTGTATSYQAGRLRAMQDPAVIEAGLDVWQYVTVGDDRVRDSHAALNGKVWEANSAEGLEHFPPNGYRCRCSMVVRSAEDIDPSQLRITVPPDAVTDGFRDNPASRIDEESEA